MAETSNPQSGGSVTAGSTSGGTPPTTTAPAASGSKAQTTEQPDTAATSGEVHKAVYDSLGGAEERIITAKDLEDNAVLDHGMEGDHKGDLHWKASNNFIVDVSHLTDEARKFLTDNEPKIKIKSKKQDA